MEKAYRSGIPALALTDTNNLYGSVYFFNRAPKYGVRPIAGSIITCPEGEAVLLVKNRKGYSNICSIISKRNLQNNFTPAETIAGHQEGLFVITGNIELAAKLAQTLDRGRLYLEIIRPENPPAFIRNILAAAKKFGLKTVATCNTYFADPPDFYIFRILRAMKLNCSLGELNGALSHRRACHLRTPKEMSWLFRELPESLKATSDISNACCFSFRNMPSVFPENRKNSPAKLRAETFEGARVRYRKMNKTILSRIKKECNIIIQMGFSDYFLIISDIVRHARALGASPAGRGSGASSIVAYCLGITDVDPIRYKLPFERFLNRKRQGYPDLDIDFCRQLRDNIIEHIYDTHGRNHVAMIASHATMQAQLAFREASRAVGIPSMAIKPLMKQIREQVPRKQWKQPDVKPALVNTAMYFARKLEGFPHHIAVHCGGVVLAPEGISKYAPLQRAAKGIVITQYDKHAIETVGLVKFDILGNRALSSMNQAIGIVKDTKGVSLDTKTFPDSDKRISRMLAAGNTIGINQLESPAMRSLLRQTKPGSRKNLMQTLALIRPGAAALGMKTSFIRRARGLEPVPHIHPALNNILRETYGIMLYEDDALFTAAALAGLSLEQADHFRRAVSKCGNDSNKLLLADRFLGLCEKNGVDGRLAGEMWTQMAKFNSYSFCRAHAASYANLAWTNTYLKCRYPLEFWTAALNNNEGMYDRWVYIEEIKRSGITILPPCINRSEEDFTVEHRSIRTGLNTVRILSARSRDSIYANRPFENTADLVARSRIQLREGKNLILSGALDFTGLTRPDLTKQLQDCFAAGKLLRGCRPLMNLPVPQTEKTPAAYPEAIRLKDEWHTLGFSLHKHPVACIRPLLKSKGAHTSRDIPRRINRRTTLCGIPAAARKIRKYNGYDCFLTLSDEHGLFETIIPSRLYKKRRHLFIENGSGFFYVTGKVKSYYDALSVRAESIRSL